MASCTHCKGTGEEPEREVPTNELVLILAAATLGGDPRVAHRAYQLTGNMDVAMEQALDAGLIFGTTHDLFEPEPVTA